MRHRIWARLALPLGLAVTALLAISSGVSGSAAPGELVGTFAISAGSCDGAVSGSYFRMILPNGGSDGPYVSNGDSGCSDNSYTSLRPGSDAGLITGGYQPRPNPAFDGGGNGVAKRITEPTPFFGVMFATSTEQVDPQTGARVPAPSISADANGKLSGVLSSFGASWNGQSFNQGSPKPDGSLSNKTTKVTGTYDAASGAFELSWSSQIQGGPFNDFTGVWRLVGTFRSAGGSPTPGQTPAGGAAAPQPPTKQGTTAKGSTTNPTQPGGGSDPAAPEADGADISAPGGAVALPEGAVASTVTTTTGGGLQPASVLVLLFGAAGIAGVLWLVWLTRTPVTGDP